MSSNLRAEPRARAKLELGSDLKLILRKRFGYPINCQIGTGELPYLQGLIDAGNEHIQKDVTALIKMINKHEEIVLREE